MKNSEDRTQSELTELVFFFRENEFFSDFHNQNGLEGLLDCLSRLKYQKINKDTFVMRQGDFGDTYYIILKGKTSVMINSDVKFEIYIPPIKSLTDFEIDKIANDFLSVFKNFVENYKFVIENEKKQKFLQELYFYFPGTVKSRETNSNKTEYYIEGILHFLFI